MCFYLSFVKFITSGKFAFLSGVKTGLTLCHLEVETGSQWRENWQTEELSTTQLNSARFANLRADQTPINSADSSPFYQHFMKTGGHKISQNQTKALVVGQQCSACLCSLIFGMPAQLIQQSVDQGVDSGRKTVLFLQRAVFC